VQNFIQFGEYHLSSVTCKLYPNRRHLSARQVII